jgi:hypothetical protein
MHTLKRYRFRQSNLRGLIRILLFKRFESSVYAFKETVRRLLMVHERFLKALEQGIVPAGEDAQTILYESDYTEEADLLDALRAVSKTYDAADFDLETLHEFASIILIAHTLVCMNSRPCNPTSPSIISSDDLSIILITHT